MISRLKFKIFLDFGRFLDGQWIQSLEFDKKSSHDNKTIKPEIF